MYRFKSCGIITEFKGKDYGLKHHCLYIVSSFSVRRDDIEVTELTSSKMSVVVKLNG